MLEVSLLHSLKLLEILLMKVMISLSNKECIASFGFSLLGEKSKKKETSFK
jgi:hypothetical protein